MRRIAVLGCALLLIAGCGGGGGSSVQGTMETGSGNGGDEMVTTDPVVPADEFTQSTTGEFRLVPVDSTGTAFTAEFYNWGVWGGVLRDDYVTCQAIGCPPTGEATFWAYLTSEMDGSVTKTLHGMQSGTSPGSGSAVWSGDVHAYETEDVMTSGGMSVTTYAPVEGDARLEVDFTAVTVDVDFTNLDNDQADISWDGLAMNNGTFGNVTEGIQGSFYGVDHEGVAGEFERDGLTGVFGALRSSE